MNKMDIEDVIAQEYDCPSSRIDFDILGEDVLCRGDSVQCSGCGGEHVAGGDLPRLQTMVYVYEDGELRNEWWGLPKDAGEKQSWIWLSMHAVQTYQASFFPLPEGGTAEYLMGDDGSPMGIRIVKMPGFIEPLITRVLYEGVELFAFEDGVRLADASFIVDRDLTLPAPGYAVEISPIAGKPLTEEEAKDRRDRAIRSLSTRQMYALCWSLSPTELQRPDTEPLASPEVMFARRYASQVGHDLKQLLASGEVSMDHLSTPKASPAWVNPRPWVRKRKGGAA